MAYMAQQWLTTTVRDAYRARSDAGEQADEAARVRAWLASLALDQAVVATLVEPMAALEDGLRQAAGERAGSTAGASAGVGGTQGARRT